MKKILKNSLRTKAFTILELVFVIVAIGILSATIIPRVESNKLEEVATQLLSHIRYTQHLAMVDDQYYAFNNEWYRDRWHIVFGTSDSTNSKIAYSIFSDKNNGSGYDSKPNLSELALDPINNSRYLSGGYSGILDTDDSQGRANKKMNIGEAYGIDSILFGGGCRSNVYHIYFDHLGRPFNSMNQNKPYENASSGWHKLLTNNCTISLCEGTCSGSTSDTEIIISIEPETGYACILNN
ncbi:MAG: type II secretion system protein, partial [Campylobacterales bacterium]|nr:type II secretion system protein [Campylobacterales bacterium]